MGRYLRIAALIIVLLLAAVLALFVVQNGARTTQLSLDLGVAAWQLAEPMSVPALLGIAFGSGFFLAALPLWLQSASRGRRVKQLESQLAVSASNSERPW